MDFEMNKLGLVSLDNIDFMRVMKGEKFTFFIENGFDTRNIAKKIKGAKRLVICVQVIEDTGMDEILKIAKSVSKSAQKNAEICWGANVGKGGKLLVIAGW